MIYITQKPGLWPFSHNSPRSSSQISWLEAEDPLTDFWSPEGWWSFQKRGSWVLVLWSRIPSLPSITLNCSAEQEHFCYVWHWDSAVCLLQQSRATLLNTPTEEGIPGEKYLTLSGVPGNMVPDGHFKVAGHKPSPKGPQKANQIIGCNL